MVPLVPMVGQIHFKDGWDTLYGAVTDAGGAGLKIGLPAIGVALVVFAIIMWLWKHFRRQQPAGGVVIAALIIGGILAGPGVVIPIILFIFDLIVNIIVAIINLFAG